MVKVLLCALLMASTTSALAVEMGAGLAAIEEGDDRIRPGILVHGQHRRYFSNFYFYGRKHGPVTERTFIISLNQKFDLFRIYNVSILRAGLGVAVMDEQIVVDIDGDTENSDSEDNFNLGAVAGLHGRIPVPGPVFVKFSWESHMFLAGLAGILLANGRKQTISLTTGVSF